MTPELAAFLQRSMGLTDEELASIVDDPEQLQALLDVALDADSPTPSGIRHLVSGAPVR